MRLIQSFFYRFFIGIWSILSFVACSDDDTPVFRLIAKPEMTPLLSPAIVLNESSATFIAEVFSWEIGDYGFSAAPVHSIQIDETNTFLDPVILGETSKDYLPVSVKTLNTAALILGATKTTPKELYIRVEARLSDSIVVHSSPISLRVTPYDQTIDYPRLYMPGSYQGWDPASAAVLTSWRLNNKYEAIVNLFDASNPSAPITFKILTAPAWGSGTEYGSGGAPGILKEGGGDISLSPQGQYKIVVNLYSMSYTATLIPQ